MERLIKYAWRVIGGSWLLLHTADTIHTALYALKQAVFTESREDDFGYEIQFQLLPNANSLIHSAYLLTFYYMQATAQDACDLRAKRIK